MVPDRNGKHSDEAREELLGNIDNFIGSMAHHMSNMLTPSLQVAMNELSNHDHSRFLTRTNHMVGRVEHLGPEAANEYVNKAVMREAVVMQMTWVGARRYIMVMRLVSVDLQIRITEEPIRGDMKIRN